MKEIIPKFIRKVDKTIPQEEKFNVNGFARIGHIFAWYGRYLSPQARVVYMAMKCVAPPDRTTHGYTDYEDRPIGKVSYDELAAITAIRRPTVVDAVAELINFKWIKKLENETGNIKEKNRYDTAGTLFPITNYNNTQEKQLRTCPTKEQARQWKKALAAKRKGKASVYAKPQEEWKDAPTQKAPARLAEIYHNRGSDTWMLSNDVMLEDDNDDQIPF